MTVDPVDAGVGGRTGFRDMLVDIFLGGASAEGQAAGKQGSDKQGIPGASSRIAHDLSSFFSARRNDRGAPGLPWVKPRVWRMTTAEHRPLGAGPFIEGI